MAPNIIPSVIDQPDTAASVGSETLSPPELDQDDFAARASTSGAGKEDEADILDNFIVTTSAALQNFDQEMPLISGGVASALRNPLNEEGKTDFSEDFHITIHDSFDAPSDADAIGGSRENTRNNTEQLFKTCTRKALQDACKRSLDVDANARLLAGAMDGVLVRFLLPLIISFLSEAECRWPPIKPKLR
jgi:hypothetical protein